MSHNRYRWPLIVLVGALVGWVCYSRVRHPDSIRYENYGQIELGMSQAQIENLLGLPPGDYATGNMNHTFRSGSVGPQPVLTIWSGNEGTIRLVFDVQNKLTFKEWLRAQREYSFAWWCNEFGCLEHAKALDLIR